MASSRSERELGDRVGKSESHMRGIQIRIVPSWHLACHTPRTLYTPKHPVTHCPSSPPPRPRLKPPLREVYRGITAPATTTTATNSKPMSLSMDRAGPQCGPRTRPSPLTSLRPSRQLETPCCGVEPMTSDKKKRGEGAGAIVTVSKVKDRHAEQCLLLRQYVCGWNYKHDSNLQCQRIICVPQTVMTHS